MNSIAVILPGLVAALAGAWLDGYRINLTPSLPIGVYQQVDEAPSLNGFVLFCLPERLRDHPTVSAFAVPPCIGKAGGPALLKRVGDIGPEGLFPDRRSSGFDRQPAVRAYPPK